MTDTTHSPSPDAFNLKQALKDAGFAGMVTFGLCVPIVAFRAEQDMANKLVLQQRWWMALVITGLVVVARFLFSLHQNSRRNEHGPQTSAGEAGALALIKPYLAPLGFGFITIYPLMMLAMHGPGGSIKWIDNFGIQILIYVMLGWGLNIVVGLAGLLDLGYVAFYAVGA
jgi:branched-chain amino acid transport system permease protein